ncbi:glycosyltransferase [Shewanella sp. MEBiC00475]|uniref:glycosyltransferase n=1 Tax=Shewanella sp. MEBiC00475 TaxID=2575361 RepID=UPI0010C0C7C5|nr:glycosyltransferase [Shewanella sp. MEBiC00475]
MKVCIVAPVHDWDDVRVFKKQAISISEFGHAVTLIANKPSDIQEYVQGIKIIRSLNVSNFRVFRFLLLPLVACQAIIQNADVYHLHNPDTIPIAIILKLLGKYVIYDTHEDFSKRILARDWVPSYLRPMLAKFVSKLESIIGSLANISIGTQESVVSRLGDKAVLIGNAPRVSEDLISKVEAIEIEKSSIECTRLIYVGSISENRGVFYMIDALNILNKSKPFRLWLIGPISGKLLNIISKRSGWEYVDYHPKMEQETAFSYINNSDIGLIYIKDVGDHKNSDPNKIYEYMTFGVPFIASKFDSWVDKLECLEAGWFIENDNVQLFAKTIINYSANASELERRGANGRRYVSKYNWNQEVKKLHDIYNNLY